MGPKMEINDIIKAFETFDGVYKRDEIDQALIKQEEITPHLISILEKVLQSPEPHADRDRDYCGHTYAYMLLSHFCETRAHDVIVDLFSLPNGLPSDLFGDGVTEDLSIVLLRTCGGNLDRVKELILNKNAYDYCRGSALETLSYALIEGYITREEIVSFYQGLFLEEETSIGSAFHDILATCVHDIYPEELMDSIEKAYEQGLINSFFICQDDFDKVLKEGKEKCLEKLRAKIQSKQMDNIHDSMSWWAGFNQPQKHLSSGASSNPIDDFTNLIGTSINPRKNRPKQDKKHKKSKKKQSQASKRANRKKKK